MQLLGDEVISIFFSMLVRLLLINAAETLSARPNDDFLFHLSCNFRAGLFVVTGDQN